jgi:hypothetical protein
MNEIAVMTLIAGYSHLTAKPWGVRLKLQSHRLEEFYI